MKHLVRAVPVLSSLLVCACGNPIIERSDRPEACSSEPLGAPLVINEVMSDNEQQLLSETWLRRAQRLNPYYQQRLGWSVPEGWPTDVASEDFAESVAFFQKENGALTVDGIVGPKTAAAFLGIKPRPAEGEFLIVAGQRVLRAAADGAP